MRKTALKVTQASLNQIALDWTQNIANHYSAIDVAVTQGSDMVLMPELSITGYEVNDDFQRTDNNRIFESLMSIAAYAHSQDPNLIISVGHPWRLQLREAFKNAKADPDLIKNPLYDRLHLPFNVQTLICGGEIISMTAKSNLFRNGRGYENRYFNEWSFRDADQVASLLNVDYKHGTLPINLPNGREIPFGSPIVYVMDRKGNAYFHVQVICESKWAATEYDGYPYDYSRYEQLNIIPSFARYLGTKNGILLEVPNASPPSMLKQDQHMKLNEHASGFVDVLVDTDGLGTSGASFAQYGHRLIAQNGKTISAGERIKFGPIATTTSVIHINSADPTLKEKTHTTLVRNFKNPAAAPQTTLAWDNENSKAAWDNPQNPDRWKEEAIRLQAFWTYDYMRKVGSVHAVNALSGGQDSAFNCVEDYVAIVMAMDELGVEGVCDDLCVPYKDKVMAAYETGGYDAALEEFMNNYLVMYYMPTSNNPDEHEKGARELVLGGNDEKTGAPFKGIGGQFHVRSIQDLVTATAMIFGVEDTTEMSWNEKRDLMAELSDFVFASPSKYTPEEMQDWSSDLQHRYPKLLDITSVALPGHSIAFENFQARLRTVLIWAVANVHKGMARANSNLSEIYTNNTTAAGDMHGGAINPNGWLHKTDQQVLLKYLEEKGLHGLLSPLRSLKQVNSNIPSAGLLPLEDGELEQTDEKTMQATMPQIKEIGLLMHHEKIKTEHGERRLNAGEIYKALQNNNHFNDLNENQLFNMIANFYRRESSGQFKRHMGVISQANGASLDKQTSTRSPNISGGSKDEIVQLGIDILFKWAKEDHLNWTQNQFDLLHLRAWQDKTFVQEFYNAIWNKDQGIKNMSYNLRGLYTDLKHNSWDNIFTPLNQRHPTYIVHNALNMK